MQKDPVEVALAACEEKGERSRACFGAFLRFFREKKGKEDGARLFVEECAALVAEIAAGEPVRNKGAALVSRLQKVKAALAAAPVPVEVAPAKVSPPPKVEAAPVPSEHDPAPAVEVEKAEDENPAPPLPALFASKRTPVAELTPEEVAEKQRQAREGLARLKKERPELWEVTDG